MLLSIVEMSDQLYINLGILKNNEDAGSCSYDRVYRFYPYSSKLSDEIVVNLDDTITQEVRGTRLPFIEREDKVPFTQYGYQCINSVESVLLRRVYPDPKVVPTI